MHIHARMLDIWLLVMVALPAEDDNSQSLMTCTRRLSTPHQAATAVAYAVASACAVNAGTAVCGVNSTGWACSTRSRRVYMSQ